MKQNLLLLSIIFSTKIFAQTILSEGTLNYTISIETLKGEKQISSPLNGAVLNLYITKDKSRTEMISTPGTETTVFDNKAGKGFILKEYSGQKLMITVSSDNWAQKNLMNSSLNFTTGNETAIIAGHSCKKATATYADGKTYTIYFDPAIMIANKNYNNAFAQIQGLPIQYELQSGNLVFKYVLSKYSINQIQTNKFDSPKSGFRIMSYEENQQLKKR